MKNAFHKMFSNITFKNVGNNISADLYFKLIEQEEDSIQLGTTILITKLLNMSSSLFYYRLHNVQRAFLMRKNVSHSFFTLEGNNEKASWKVRLCLCFQISNLNSTYRKSLIPFILNHYFCCFQV